MFGATHAPLMHLFLQIGLHLYLSEASLENPGRHVHVSGSVQVPLTQGWEQVGLQVAFCDGSGV